MASWYHRRIVKLCARLPVSLLLMGLGVLAGLAAAPLSALAADCYGDFPGNLPEPVPSDRSLRFGIFPGGPAGVIAGPRPPAAPEDQGKIDRALARLAGGGPFVVHLYTEYTKPGKSAKALKRAKRTARHYAREGLRTEYVLRYRPADAPDVRGYARFVRQAVRRLGAVRGLRAIQVTNEVNNSLSPDASDGAYEGAERALVRGVIAAERVARHEGLRRLEVGFNWFYRMDPGTEDDFWSRLKELGGRRFARAVGWVGLDAYPGTFFPPATPPPDSFGDSGDAMVNALGTLRCYAGSAGIPDSTPIHVTENGWPTSSARTESEQEAELREMVGAVAAYRENFNVTDYRWFDLRDSNSSSPDFQQHYGLTRDDYSKKPAFGAYRKLIKRFA
jgi:hypothetical protein